MKLLRAPGIATRSKDATNGAPGLTTRNKRTLRTEPGGSDRTYEVGHPVSGRAIFGSCFEGDGPVTRVKVGRCGNVVEAAKSGR